MNQSDPIFGNASPRSIPFEEIRRALPIATVWRHFNLPGNPARSCCSPFRPDKNPSFSVFHRQDGYDYFFDFADADTCGDVVDFYALAAACDNKTAAAECYKLAFHRPMTEPVPAPDSKKISWPPDLRELTNLECRELEKLRGIYYGAFDLATKLGLLKIGTVWGHRSWIVQDISGRLAEARRFDGEKFDGVHKSKALTGSVKNGLPLGCLTNSNLLNQVHRLVLVEGAPDLMAAFAILIDYPIAARPMCMLGASTNITAGDFTGDQVVIIPHNDEEGLAASERWADQIEKRGGDVIYSWLDKRFSDLDEMLRDSIQNGTDPVDCLPWHQFNKVPARES